MACGQKKQNTNEGGVHLTERTCSPYNPIIKQIVDDCLGLPIYPVTSIDAVIDEDGNTLRKLLEDLLDQIKTGGSITEQIEHILQIIEDLDETYVTKTELTQKLELLYKISSMNRTNVDGVQNYDTTETTKPYIVKIIEDIQSNLAGIMSGGDGITLQSLQEQITALNTLLIAVANYDTSLHTDAGLTHSQNNTIPQIEIIYRIQDLITRLGAVERAIGTGSSIDTRLEEIERALAGLLDGASTVLGITDALDGRVDILEDKVEDLEADSATHAHLDDVLLGQRVAKLEADEYPVTSAYFLSSAYTLDKFIDNVIRTNSFRRDFIYIPRYTAIGVPDDNHSQFDYNSNDLIDYGDALYIVNHILERYHPDLPDGTTLDVASDQEINNQDLQAIYNIIGSYNHPDRVTYSNVEWSKYIYEIIYDPNMMIEAQPQGTEYGKEVSDLFPGYKVIKHPLIDGKLYANKATNTLSRFEDKSTYGRMVDVSHYEGANGIQITYNDNSNATISTNFEGAKGIDIEEANPGEPVVITQKTTCWHVDSGAEVVAGSLYIAGETVQVLHGFITDSTNRPPAGTGSNLPEIDINNVTRLINFVLGTGTTSTSGQIEHGSYMFRVLNYLINFTTDIEPTTTNGATIKSTILDELNSYLSPVSDYIEGRQAYQQMTSDVETLVSQHLEMQALPLSNVPHASNNHMLLQANAETWYLWGWDSQKETWVPYEIKATDVSQPEISGVVMDFTDNGICDINDVTLAIEKVLTDVGSYTPHFVEVTITPTLYKKNTNSSEAVVNCEGIEVLDQNQRLWYVYDEAGHVKMEQTRLVVEQAGDILGLQLHENGQKTSEVLLSDHLNDYIINNVSIKLDATNKNMLQLVVGGRVVQSLDLTDAIEAVVEEQSADVGN